MINFTSSKYEFEQILQIAERAEKIARERKLPIPGRCTLLMDIEACHCNGMPLHLSRLLEAPQFDFTHDVWGIIRHINRETGQIENCFVPRCALPNHCTVIDDR